ncbi:MAG: protein kinase [Gammaproteobacteria bacterium]
MPIISDFDDIQEHFQNATEHFENHQQAIKYSRKESKLPLSFIKTTNEHTSNIFAISKTILNKGITSTIKLGKNINTQELVAIKIQLLELDAADLSKDFNKEFNQEIQILDQLDQLRGRTIKLHKSTNTTVALVIKSYIIRVFFEGVSLKEYFLSNNSTIIHTLEIILKILEQVKILHKQNITHGDLSFNKILINKKPDGEIEVNIIDFGLAGILQEGIRIFLVQEFEFSTHSYTPPECDYKISPHLIISSIGSDNHNSIYTWANKGYGFHTASSDLYTLIWCIDCCVKKQDRVLSYLFDKTCSQLCHDKRPSIDDITNLCQQYLENLTLNTNDNAASQEDPARTPISLLFS